MCKLYITPKELKETIEEHKEWLKDHSKGRQANFRLVDLQDADLQGVDLRYADFMDADLQGANLQGADLRGANLWYANLRNANLQGAKLQKATISDADLRYANMVNANLHGATMGGAIMQDANLHNTNLQNVLLNWAIGNNREVLTLCVGSFHTTYTKTDVFVGYKKMSKEDFYKLTKEQALKFFEGDEAPEVIVNFYDNYFKNIKELIKNS